MKTFLSDHFLLRSDAAFELYHNYARPQPIYDYHSHLPSREIADNRRFENLYEAWLAGDHYKWRAMRWNGVPEKYCTGDASPWEKFLAYASTVPRTLRNPLYHWTHLELKYYFGIDELLDETTAESIWNRANAQLKELPVHELLRTSDVAVVCTTDDPVESLEDHRQIREEGKLTTRVYPTFRPDKALAVDQPELFVSWLDRLSEASGIECADFRDFLSALEQRHTFFHQAGGRLSDHGLAVCQAEDCTEQEAQHCFDEARAGRQVGPGSAAKFRAYLMLFFGGLDAERGWTKQLHLGALRNSSARALHEIGPDSGFDSIGDLPQGAALARYLNNLERENRLPKMVLYNVNPVDNYVVATMAANFQGGGVPGKIQFGSGWWFLDQKEGMTWQLNALSQLGLLSRFVGMLTDSRSFLSFPRHEYFRRILCNLIGEDVVHGELPCDMKLLGGLVSDICFHNARRYFGLELPESGVA